MAETPIDQAGVALGGASPRRFQLSHPQSPAPVCLWWPTLRFLRTRFPDLAGMLLRNWEREGCLVVYRHGRRDGFVIVAVYPRWRWIPRLTFWLWPRWKWVCGWAVLGLVLLCVAVRFGIPAVLVLILVGLMERLKMGGRR